MKQRENKKVVTRDMPSKGEGMLNTYHFPGVGNIQATSLSEAQAKAEAKTKAIKSK